MPQRALSFPFWVMLCLLCCLPASVGRSADEVTLEEPDTDIRVRQVSTEVRTSGKVFTNAGGGKTSEHPLSATALFRYRERRLPPGGRDFQSLRVLREFDLAKMQTQVSGHDSGAELPATQRLVVVQGERSGLQCYSPGQAMSRESVDLLELPGDPLILTALLPRTTVAPGAQWTGIGRISTGLGCPHLETDPDFLGLMVAFQTQSGVRVDFLTINDPTSPTDVHPQFVKLLDATADAAGAEPAFGSGAGQLDLANLAASNLRLIKSLIESLGPVLGLKVATHVAKQTSRTALSSTAYQTYWTGIAEVGGVQLLQALLVGGIEFLALAVGEGHGFADRHLVGRQSSVLPAVEDPGEDPCWPSFFVDVRHF